jgi:hypothetical protein
MTQQEYKHPITPPPELVQQWCHDRNRWTDFENVLAIRAADWGYQQRCLEEHGYPLKLGEFYAS